MFDVRTQLKNAIDALAETAKTAADWVAEKSDSAKQSTSDAVGSVRDQVTQTARGIADSTARAKTSAIDACMDTVAETKQGLIRANDELVDTIKRHPITTLAIAFGIGMMIGKHFRRSIASSEE